MPIQEKTIAEELESLITEDCRAVTDESGLLVITHEMMRQWDSIHGHLSPCGIFAVARIEAGEDVAAVAREGLERGFDDFDTLLKTPSNELGRFYDTDESFKLGFISLLARKNFEGGGALTEEDLRQTMFRLRNQFSFKRDWTSFVRRCAAGDYSSGSSVLMAMFPDHQVPEMGGQTTWPLIILHEDGTRSFGLMYHSTIFAPSSPLIRFWAVRNFMIIKNAPISNVLVDPATGTLLWQNPASCSEIGVHSLENSQPARGSQSRKPSLNFLALLFEGQDEVREEMLEEVKNGASFAKAVEIHSLELKRMLGCHNPEDPLFLKVYASQFYDPYSQKQCLNIVYVDKTAVILAQREVQQANADLAEEKQRLHVLLTRQYQLIEVMQSSFRNDPETDSPKNVLFKQKIQVLRDILSSAKGADEGVEEISLGRILGQGNFGKVYLGTWRGTTVAVKRMVLPAAMSDSERAHKMAVMEIGISSSLSHPHLVQTYTYSIKAIQEEEDKLAQAVENESRPLSYELRLVLEYCDKGSLSSILSRHGGFEDEEGRLDYAAVLETAADIAKGMLHLHKNNICHNDLKASNVLFKSEGDDGRGVRAKVVDFGLSIKLDTAATHTSNAFEGTMTHMAPEVMMEGKQSKSADVYSFGITLWELITGGSPYHGLPKAALCQLVVFQHKRPAWPETTPPEYKALAEECWQPKAEARPSFDSVLEKLIKMRAGLNERSRPISTVLLRQPPHPRHETLALGTAINASINESMDDWFPTIMSAPIEALPSAPYSPAHLNLSMDTSSTPSLRSNHQQSDRQHSNNILNLQDLRLAAEGSARGKGLRGSDNCKRDSYTANSS